MQLPQLYRRGVVRPLDDFAAQQLATFYVDRPIRVEWLAIPGEDQFTAIWLSGVLGQINDACGTLISDYEEEALPAEQVGVALTTVRAAMPAGDSARFFRNLEALLADAMAAKQAVYFIL